MLDNLTYPSQQVDNFFICASRPVQELSVSTDQWELLQITDNKLYFGGSKWFLLKTILCINFPINCIVLFLVVRQQMKYIWDDKDSGVSSEEVKEA